MRSGRCRTSDGLGIAGRADAVHGGALSPGELAQEAVESLCRGQPVTAPAASQLWPEALAAARVLRPALHGEGNGDACR